MCIMTLPHRRRVCCHYLYHEPLIRYPFGLLFRMEGAWVGKAVAAFQEGWFGTDLVGAAVPRRRKLSREIPASAEYIGYPFPFRPRKITHDDAVPGIVVFRIYDNVPACNDAGHDGFPQFLCLFDSLSVVGKTKGAAKLQIRRIAVPFRISLFPDAKQHHVGLFGFSRIGDDLDAVRCPIPFKSILYGRYARNILLGGTVPFDRPAAALYRGVIRRRSRDIDLRAFLQRQDLRIVFQEDKVLQPVLPPLSCIP